MMAKNRRAVVGAAAKKTEGGRRKTGDSRHGARWSSAVVKREAYVVKRGITPEAFGIPRRTGSYDMGDSRYS